MKKNLIIKLLPACVILFCCMQNNLILAQELLTNTLSADIYKDARLYKTTIAKKVADAFYGINTSTTLNINTPEDEATERIKNELRPYVKDVQLFNLKNLPVFRSLTGGVRSQLTISVPSKYGELLLDLVQSDIFADGFKVLTDKNPQGIAVQTGVHYFGVVRGRESVVSASIFDDEVNALISIKGKSAIELVKLRGQKAGNNIHAVYDEADLLNQDLSSRICTTPDIDKSYLNPLKNFSTPNFKEFEELPVKCVTNFWEAAYNEYLQFGSNVQSVNNFITSLFNKYATIFTNENIGMKLQSTFIWTSPDPYNHASSETGLTTFSNLRINFGADLAMLLSTTGGGGQAWLDILCNPNEVYHHSFCGSITDAGAALPTYSWAVEVTTHEVGHNLGSPHTHACAWNGNNTAIDGCGPTYGVNFNPPIAYEGNCNGGPIPAKGTIMSYCHLGAAGIDLNLGFGPQPGDLIRNRVNTCIANICPGSCPDNLTINIPLNGIAKFEVVNYIIGSSSVTTNANQIIRFDAGKYVQLQPGFLTNTAAGGYFSAYIDGCGGNYLINPMPVNNSAQAYVINGSGIDKIYPTPFADKLTINFHIAGKNKKAYMEVYSITGVKIKTLLSENKSIPGNRSIEWNTGTLSSGTYLVVLTTDTGKEVKKVVKVL